VIHIDDSEGGTLPLHLKTRVSRVGTVVAGCVVFATALVGCSSSGSSGGGSSSNSQGATTASSGTSIAAGGADACTQHAQSALDAAQKEQPVSYPTAKIDTTKLAGKTIWWISATQEVPLDVVISKEFTEAAALAKVKVHIFDGQGSPALYTTGIQQALANKADAIVLYGFSEVAAPLAAADAVKAHVPLITVAPGADTPGIIRANLNPYDNAGTVMADAALAQTKCKANVLEFTLAQYPIIQQEAAAIKAELDKYCPKDCKLTVQDMDPAKPAAMQATAPTELRAHPDTNFIIISNDTWAGYAASGLATVSKAPPMISVEGSDLKLVQNGQQFADAVRAPAEFSGYQQFDSTARAMLGVPQAPEDLKAPNFAFVTKKRLAATPGGVNADFFAYAGDFKSKWAALWNVQ
jgi:ribose transport system substrate-binding protein